MLSFHMILAQHPRLTLFDSLVFVQPLCFQSLAHSFSPRTTSISFSFNHFYTLSIVTEGEGGSALFPRSDIQTCNCVNMFPSYPLCIDTLANSFALAQTSTLLFSSNSALFAQNTRGGGRGELKTSWLASPKGTSRIHFSFQPLTKCNFRNYFVLIFIQIGGGMGGVRP